MGRKNRNARNRNFSSFEALKSSTVRFDLSTGNFIKKTGVQKVTSKDAEVNINVISGGRNQGLCISFSIHGDVSKKMLDDGGKYWSCGIVQSCGFERLYLIPDERGYALCQNAVCSRRYVKMPIDDAMPFDKYIGFHKMQYDDVNKAYYIAANE